MAILQSFLSEVQVSSSIQSRFSIPENTRLMIFFSKYTRYLTRTRNFYQYPNLIGPEVENTSPLGLAQCTSGAHHVICFPACSLPLACQCPPGQKCWETATAHRHPVQKFNLGPRFTFCAIRKTLPCHVLPILPSIALYYISLLSGLGNI